MIIDCFNEEVFSTMTTLPRWKIIFEEKQLHIFRKYIALMKKLIALSLKNNLNYLDRQKHHDVNHIQLNHK